MTVAQMFGQTVLLWNGERMLPATLSPRLKPRARGGPVGVTVGDDVQTEQDSSGALAVVSVAPRRTQLARMSGNGRDVQVVAANAEQVVIVSSAAEPPFRHGLVDRWALLARRGGIEPLLCLNKIDLVTSEEAERMIAEAAIPLRRVLVSVKTGDGIDDLRAVLRERASVLVGHSGVGKSSLLRLLVPEEQIVTGELSVKSGKGRHTTSSARLYAIPDGGMVIDTPGVRSVALGETSAAEVANVFPEIGDASPCRFDTCTHRMEPGCSVLAGVGDGTIPRQVYARYRKLLLEAEVP